MQLDPITIQVLWNRLVSLVDEAATGLLRTAYTPSVKEYHDFCCALFDRDANMMSHSTITTAGFLGIVPEVMRNFIERHPPDTLRPGDVLITNDPWLASGHLIDVSVAAPIYHHGHLVGFTLCIVHQLDMGGRMSTLESQDVYEEGLKIPVLKLYDEGRLNETVFEFLRANIRVPDKVIGDIRAQLVANHVCTQGLVQLLDEFALDGLEDLSREIVMRTERSLRRKIAELPDGIYRNAVRLPRIPGCSDDIDIRAAVIVDGDGVTVDFTGTSGEVGAAVNCTFNMTRSYTAYPFKLALDPDVPNNAGGLEAHPRAGPGGNGAQLPAAGCHLGPHHGFAAPARDHVRRARGRHAGRHLRRERRHALQRGVPPRPAPGRSDLLRHRQPHGRIRRPRRRRRAVHAVLSQQHGAISPSRSRRTRQPSSTTARSSSSIRRDPDDGAAASVRRWDSAFWKESTRRPAARSRRWCA